MKTLSSICLILTFGCVIADYVGMYSLGWMSGWFQLSNPIILILILAVLFLILCGAVSVSIFQQKGIAWTSSMLAAFVSVLAVEHYLMPSPASTLVYGIRDHVMKVCTLNDLRQFAQSIHRDVPGVDVFHGDEQSLFGDRALAFSKLKQAYPFLNWGLGGSHDASVSESKDAVPVVTVEWGGALSGHWGFSVSIDGSRNVPETDAEIQVIQMSNDIYFFHGE